MPGSAPYPLRALRALALHAQGLHTQSLHARGSAATPTPDTIFEAVNQIGCVQIDTLYVVQRSHYLALWSRLGSYDPADFEQLIYSDDRRLYEYWLHAACILPLAEYRYNLPKQRYYREGRGGWNRTWKAQPENLALLEQVRARIAQEGPLRTADFKHDGDKRGSWWDWKPAKRALEVLYDEGALMISRRHNFQRVYDLRQRVLPDWVDQREPTPVEATRHWVARAAQVFGICEPLQTADYAYLKRTEARPVIEALLNEGTLLAVQGEFADGEAHDLVIHKNTLPLLEQAADGAITAQRTTFLSPFDNLLWPKERDAQLWNFWQRLEAYKKAEDRIYGYFCLPILHKDRLVGRFDPKLERKTGLLRLKALYLEPGVAPDEALVADVAVAMRDFMAFHEATELVIEQSDPPAFGEKLLAAM